MLQKRFLNLRKMFIKC